jgi:hypothetical protein
MILDKNNVPFLVNGTQLQLGDKVLVGSRLGDYKTTVIQDFFSYTLEENYTEFKDSACLYGVKEIIND